MNNFVIRAITATVFVIVLLGCIIAGRYSFVALFLFLTIAGLLEFYNILLKARYKAQKVYGVLLGALLFLVNFVYSCYLPDSKLFLVFFPLFAFIFIIELFRNRKRPIANVAVTFLGIIYIAVPFSLLNYLVFKGELEKIYNPHLLLGLFFLLWTSDTGAYLTGVTMGKHKMFKRISPKKTWEGFAGGAILTIIVGWAISKYFLEITTANWIVIGLIVVITGVFGDLVESMFKRSLQIKDSGNILPGHGGILDRFDSILLSAPIVFAYLQFIA